MIYAGWQNVTKIMPLLDIGHTAHGLCPTCVTFSVTLCVRSMSLQGAMMSISPEGRAMSGSGLKSTKLSVIWGILEMVRYRMRSESDVEFSMFNLLFTAPGNMQMKFNNQVRKQQENIWSHLRLLTGAAAGRPDARPPVLPIPFRPHGLDLVYGGGTTHAVKAFSRAAVRQRTVGGRAFGVEAEPVVGCYAGWGMGEGTHQVGSVGLMWWNGYRRLRAQ